MHKSVCRKSFQNIQPEQRLGNWELTFYLRKVEELALESKQLTFAFATSLIWLNITLIFHLPKQIQLGMPLKVNLTFLMNEEKGWILNGTVILVYSTTWTQRFKFQQLLCCLPPCISAAEFFSMFQSLVLRPGQLT